MSRANIGADMHLLLSLALVFCFQVTILQAYCNSFQELTAREAAIETRRQVNNNPDQDENHFRLKSPELNQTSDSSRRANESRLSLNDFDKFRLEYNKYKILSHLSITADLDEITPRIDEDLRYELLSSAAFKNTVGSDTTSSRRKRSLTCDQVKNEKNACCLDNFYVNFTHIGWDKWILYPPGYQANYCRGKCDLSHARYYHSTLLSKYSHVISLCCSPKQMAPLSLLYIDEENRVHQKSIPDMVVESCDCA